MATGETLHPDFVKALRAAGRRLGYAEAWRLLEPVAIRLGLPKPSYPTVRRFLVEERARQRRRAQYRERVVTDLLSGRVPRLVP